MPDDISADINAVQRIDGIHTLLEKLCALTGMGFAAVARVTDTRWVACLVKDAIAFGLEAGDELKVRTTICDEIRDSREGVMIDHVAKEPIWRIHPTPVIYGFQSYISMPIIRRDGSVFGTLCAVDPEPRTSSLLDVAEAVRTMAQSIADALDAQTGAGEQGHL